MGREWFAVYSALINHVKYRRLSPSARGALLHVWALATTSTPEANWPTRDVLIELLGFDGFAPSAYEELMSGGWLEADDDGGIWVHDWDEHQLAATAAIRRAYEAARKSDWRRSRTPSPEPSSPKQDRTEQYKGLVHVPDTSGTPFDLDTYKHVVSEQTRKRLGIPPD